MCAEDMSTMTPGKAGSQEDQKGMGGSLDDHRLSVGDICQSMAHGVCYLRDRQGDRVHTLNVERSY